MMAEDDSFGDGSTRHERLALGCNDSFANVQVPGPVYHVHEESQVPYLRRQPHPHILLWVGDSWRMLMSEHYDRIVASEIPDPGRNPNGRSWLWRGRYK
jgi:hypothetical protein